MKSIRHVITNGLALILSMLALTTITPAAAQTTSPTSLVVRVSASNSDGQSLDYLLLASSDKVEPFDMPFDVKSQDYTISPDRQWMAYLIDADGTYTLTYSKKGQPATTLKFPEHTPVSAPGFSPDNKYFTYGVGSPTNDSWKLHIMTLSTGKQLVLGSKSNGALDSPQIAGWNPDGKQIYVLPSIVGIPFGVNPTKIDLSTIRPGNQSVPLPAGKLLLDSKYSNIFGYPQFSPDTSKMVFTFFDSDRPVKDFVGPGLPLNTIGLYDVKTGETKIVYQAPKDVILSQAMWSGDGTKLAWEGGQYMLNQTLGTPTVVSPKLYLLDVGTGEVSDGASISVTPADYVSVLKVCGDTLFYTISSGHADKITSSLYSVPLSDLTKQGKPLHTIEGGYQALDCVVP